MAVVKVQKNAIKPLLSTGGQGVKASGRAPAAAKAVVKVALPESAHVSGAARVVLLAQALATAKAKLGVLSLPLLTNLALTCTVASVISMPRWRTNVPVSGRRKKQELH